MEEHRIIKLVTAVHRDLILTDENYRDLWAATADADAIEGSLARDTYCAAAMVRARGKQSTVAIPLEVIIGALLDITGRTDRAYAVRHYQIEAEFERLESGLVRYPR